MKQIETGTTGHNPLNRLLRCRQTQRYFKAGGWTHDLNQADCFSSQFEAIQACIQHNLKEVELVLRAPGGYADLFATVVR